MVCRRSIADPAAGLPSARSAAASTALLVAHMKLPPFIVTLGTWQIILATNFLYSANETIRSPGHRRAGAAPAAVRPNFRIGSAVFTYGVDRHGRCWSLFSGTCSTTRPGAAMSTRSATIRRRRSCRASDQTHADLGLRDLGPDLRACRLGAHRPHRLGLADRPASPPIIESITAVVIGGISLFGGRGSILGMLFGALIVGVFSLGLRLLGTDPQWKYLLIGVLIIGAVAIDQWIRKVSG